MCHFITKCHRFVILASAAALIAAGNIGSAVASLLTLQLTVGASTDTFTDGGSGILNLSNTSLGSWYIGSISAYSQPLEGDATDNYLIINCGSVDTTGSTALKVSATESGFSANPTANNLAIVLNDGSNSSETAAINGTTVGSALGPGPSTESVSVSGPASTFSMTDTLVIQPASPASCFGELYLHSVVVPEPATFTLLGTALVGLVGFLSARRRRGMA